MMNREQLAADIKKTIEREHGLHDTVVRVDADQWISLLVPIPEQMMSIPGPLCGGSFGDFRFDSFGPEGVLFRIPLEEYLEEYERLETMMEMAEQSIRRAHKEECESVSVALDNEYQKEHPGSLQLITVTVRLKPGARFIVDDGLALEEACDRVLVFSTDCATLEEWYLND